MCVCVRACVRARECLCVSVWECACAIVRACVRAFCVPELELLNAHRVGQGERLASAVAFPPAVSPLTQAAAFRLREY